MHAGQICKTGLAAFSFLNRQICRETPYTTCTKQSNEGSDVQANTVADIPQTARRRLCGDPSWVLGILDRFTTFLREEQERARSVYSSVSGGGLSVTGYLDSNRQVHLAFQVVRGGPSQTLSEEFCKDLGGRQHLRGSERGE
jgi:hypothetical protein